MMVCKCLYFYTYYLVGSREALGHDLTEHLPGDHVGPVTGCTEPVIVLLHLLGTQPSLSDQELELLLGEWGDHGHGAGPPPHPVQVQRGIIAHPWLSELFSSISISHLSAGVFWRYTC